MKKEDVNFHLLSTEDEGFEHYGVLLRVSTAMMKHCEQKHLEKKEHYISLFIIKKKKSGQELKQGRKLEASAGEEAMKDVAY